MIGAWIPVFRLHINNDGNWCWLVEYFNSPTYSEHVYKCWEK